MIPMRKNKKSTARGDVKRHRKKLEVRNTVATTSCTLALKGSKKADGPPEQKESTSESTIIDKRRVNTIRRAIQKGDYKIDCSRTAEKLLQLEKDIWDDV